VTTEKRRLILAGVFAGLLVIGVAVGRMRAASMTHPSAREPGARLAVLARQAVRLYERTGRICGSGEPFPHAIPSADEVVESSAADWQLGDERSGFVCLGFEAVGPVRWRYRYESVDGGIVVSAERDKDGDGVAEVQRIRGEMTSRGTLRLRPLEIEAAGE
jgi:hypothetical protein